MKLRLGAYQGTPIVGNVDATLDVVASVLEQAQHQQLHVVLFPELFLCGYDIGVEALHQAALSLDSDIMSKMASLAVQYQVCYGIGYSEKCCDHTSTTYYNSLVIFDSKGSIVLNYRKTHLWDPGFNYEKKAFSAGSSLPVAKLNVTINNADITVTIGALICFDSEFPEPARVLALQGAELILIATAGIDLYVPPVVIRSRAMENKAIVMFSNLLGPCSLAENNNKPFCGMSSIIAPDGSVLAQGSSTDSSLVIAEVDREDYRQHIWRNDYLTERRPELYRNMM